MTPRSRLALLFAPALLLLAASGLRAEETAKAPAAEPGDTGKRENGKKPRDPYLSSWGRIVLSRCASVVSGKVVKLYTLPTRITVATFRFGEVLHGKGEEGDEVLVLTSDPRFFKTEDELILFLVPESDEQRYRALDKIDLKAKGGDLRADVVRRILAVEAMENPKKQRSRFKALLFENLARPDRWCRDNAVREFHILTEREPEIFTDAEVGRLRKEALAMKSEKARVQLGYALAHLEVLPDLRKAIGAGEEARAEGLARLEALVSETGVPAERIRLREDVIFQQYRAKADAAVRAEIIRIASILGRPRFLTGVIKALWDADHRVRIEALKGLRRFGSRRAAKSVARCLEDPFPAVRAEAAATLGVIGSAAHAQALRKMAEDEQETAAVRDAAARALAAIEAGK
jgi:hypothetical protein